MRPSLSIRSRTTPLCSGMILSSSCTLTHSGRRAHFVPYSFPRSRLHRALEFQHFPAETERARRSVHSHQTGRSSPLPRIGATPTIHRVHNLGPGTFDVLDIEILQRPQQPSASEAGPVAIENPSARVYKWTLAPGATSAMHTHTRPYLIVAVTRMPLKMSAPDGQSSSHEVQAGDFHWIDAKVTHSLTNEGTTRRSDCRGRTEVVATRRRLSLSPSPLLPTN